MSDERQSYIIESVDDVSAEFGTFIGSVTDALTRRVIGSWKTPMGTFRAVIGEPLCCGCDAPVSDGPCGCMREVVRPRRLPMRSKMTGEQ